MKNIYQEQHYENARKLVSQMSVEEKTSQLCSEAPAIKRLNIPAYHWWNEGLHGVARAGSATVFPQAIGLAATFSKETLATVGNITALEGRIKYNIASANGDRGIYKGLTFWSPNINIYRDPRWGRGHETFGEDPVLTAICAENYITAIQGGEDDKYMKAAACAKHFAVHSGPEGNRHGFDSVVSEFDLYDTYLPAFEWSIKKADVEGVMGAYNTINGVHSCANEPYMEGLLRKDWGFNGYYVSDCGALADIHMFCLITHTAIESATLALKAGCDLNCGQVYLHVLQAYNEGKVTEPEIDRAVIRIMATRFKLGLFDENCVYNNDTDYLKVECEEHLQMAYDASAKSIVMLKNDGLLPLKADTKTIGVIGPNATNIRALEGNYNGTATKYHTILDGIIETAPANTRVISARGCHLYKDLLESCSNSKDGFSEAVAVAQNSDVVVMVMGLDPSIEGEQGDTFNEYGAGDKMSLSFPGLQCELLEEIKKVGKPMILVTLAGGILDLNWADENCNAILYGWYPGSEGGKAIADIIFGNYNPSGKTPLTFYRSLDDIGGFEDYNMQGRTYRYLTTKPLYEFGFGLSYTNFDFSDMKENGSYENNDFTVAVTVKNTGDYAGGTPIQIYANYKDEQYIMPNKKLCGIEYISLKKGEQKQVTVSIDSLAVMLTKQDGTRYMPQNKVTYTVQ